MKLKILIVKFSDASRAPRVLSQLEFLKGTEAEITVAAHGNSPGYGVSFHQLRKPYGGMIKKLKQFLQLLGWYRIVQLFFVAEYLDLKKLAASIKVSKKSKNASSAFDLVIVHDPFPLAFILNLFPGAKIHVDLHEYTPGQISKSNFLKYRVFQKYSIWICRKYLKYGDYFTTVCKPISRLYEKQIGIKSEVIYNIPSAMKTQKICDLSSDRRFVHHGVGTPERGAHKLVEFARYLPEGQSLTLILVTPTVSSKIYVGELQRKVKAENLPVFFERPVASLQITKKLSEYDVFVYLLEDSTINHRLAMPNKFFEAIHAGLPVAIGPSEAMAEVVNEFAIGVVADTFDPKDLANKVSNISLDEWKDMRENLSKCSEKYSFVANKEAFLSYLKPVLGASVAQRRSSTDENTVSAYDREFA